MRQAGFVLTGGRSRRMGRDKPLLPYNGKTLLDHIAGEVLEAAGRVTLIGSPELYGKLGYPAYPDSIPECGPLGGIYTALRLQQATWNLILACDLPNVRAADLRHILEATADHDTVDCVIPVTAEGGQQPLCAVYHARCVSKLEEALGSKCFKIIHFVAKLNILEITNLRPELFVNVNTPADWEKIQSSAKPARA